MRKSILNLLSKDYLLQLNSTCNFSNDTCYYYRYENEDNMIVYPNYNLGTGEIIVNSTGKLILNLCNGSNTIDDLYNELTHIYNNEDEDIIYNDLINILFNFTNIGILTWKGENPFIMNNLDVFENYTLRVATEEDTEDILNFVNENGYEINISQTLISYDCNKMVFEDYLRWSFFSLLEDIFIIKQGDLIIGMLSISTPQEFNSTASRITNIKCNIEQFPILLKYAIDKLEEISIARTTKVILILVDKSNHQKYINDILIKSEFNKECKLLKEYGDLDATRYSYIY